MLNAAMTMTDALHTESFTDAREDDFVLVRAASGGDQKAFEQLYRKHSKRLMSVIWRLCGGSQSRAEDCLHEAFVKAWQALPSFRYLRQALTQSPQVSVATAMYSPHRPASCRWKVLAAMSA